MKISAAWLRSWVNPSLSLEELSAQLTLSGSEIESTLPVCERFQGVVVGLVKAIAPHPSADRLQVCTVEVGKSAPLSIVCGAKNVAVDMKVAAAIDQAILPNNVHIKETELRGVPSQGMLCSARELGLSEEAEGLIALPQDAPIGKSVWEYLDLEDQIIEIGITPNRGDCLSAEGLAIEISALTGAPITAPAITAVPAGIQDKLAIHLKAGKDAPAYAGRIIKNIQASALTPVWMRERLRRSGVRSISVIVDIMNYVMLELGQPMHAFDLEQLKGDITVRYAKANESIKLLDDSTVTCETNTVLIADDHQALAIAGIMGGLESAVTFDTKHVFLESAYFAPTAIASTARKFHLSSDSAYRFERGIDPLLQTRAIERATALILEFAGGVAGPVTLETLPELPQEKIISLRDTRLENLLGYKLEDEAVEALLSRLQFGVKKSYDAFAWRITVPARRSDITIEEDLVEEIARLYGYDRLPQTDPMAHLVSPQLPEAHLTLSRIREALCDAGYHEVITYSFIDEALQKLLDPKATAKPVLNPMTAEMGVMRTQLFAGLINTYLYNQNRQQTRVRIFESGLRFLNEKALLQEPMLAGLIAGSARGEQWGESERAVDFYDAKGDLENLFQLGLHLQNATFLKGEHPSLHPGRTAKIWLEGVEIGVMGQLHPKIAKSLKIDTNLFLWELSLEKLETARLPRYVPLSKFPEIRRDLAFLIDQAIASSDIQCTIKDIAGDLLQAINLFDVYQGKGIAPGRKSIALALTLQHASRTLVDEEVADLMERVIVTLKERYNAELRG